MPQQFHVLQCFSCQTFQVQHVKKCSKWACKMCGEKQSIKKVFGQGSGADCRKHVQSLNTMRGEMDGHQRGSMMGSYEDEGPPPEDVQKVSFVSANKQGTSTYNKWEQYMPDEELNADDYRGPEDDTPGRRFTTSRQEYDEARRDNARLQRKRFTKDSEHVCLRKKQAIATNCDYADISIDSQQTTRDVDFSNHYQCDNNVAYVSDDIEESLQANVGSLMSPGVNMDHSTKHSDEGIVPSVNVNAAHVDSKWSRYAPSCVAVSNSYGTGVTIDNRRTVNTTETKHNTSKRNKYATSKENEMDCSVTDLVPNMWKEHKNVAVKAIGNVHYVAHVEEKENTITNSRNLPFSLQPCFTLADSDFDLDFNL